jgi:hypothetical protein
MKITSSQQLIEFHNELTGKALEIMKRKNKDYADPDKSGDPFKNFRMCEMEGVCSAEAGIMIRLGDKRQRLVNLLENAPAVTDESFEDTVLDSINYLILLAAMRKK